MIQYIYFVKCPNCEDEHFDFFDEAKEFALGCLSDKPVITQVEVCRNDFGECTDSTDLGQVWSWEDEVDVSADDPAVSIFTKGDFTKYNPEHDAEFDALDNSLDFVPDNFRKPIPADMTIESLVEAMEENEDTVECKWCNELFDKSEVRYEVDLGYLCSQCEAAIKSRGETLTFKEDFKRDPLDHHDPDYDEEDAADYLANQTDRVADLDFDAAVDSLEEDVLSESATAGVETVDLEYDDLTINVQSPKYDEASWDEVKHTSRFTYTIPKEYVIETLWDTFITEEDVAVVPGGFEALEKDDDIWNAFIDVYFDTLFEKYYKQLLEYYRDKAVEAYEEEYTWSDYQNDRMSDWYDESLLPTTPKTSSASSMLEELEEAEEYQKRLSLCPECGTKNFDTETAICMNCGFNALM